MRQGSWLSPWGRWTAVLGSLVGVTAVALPRLPAADTWWHLAAGRLLVEVGRLPAEDPFSFGPGRGPWLNHEWLAEVLFYGLYRLGGLDGLFLVRTLMVVLAFWILPVLGARRRGVPAVAAGLVALACSLGGEGWAFFDARAYLFTYLGVSFTVLATMEYLRTGSRRWLLALPIATAVWANCHGGFILGPVALVTAAAGCLLPPASPRRAVDLGVTALAAVGLAAVATPYGLETLAFPFSLLTRSPFSLGLNEWARPDLLGAQWPYLVLVVVSAGMLVRTPASWPVRLWALGFLGAGMLAWRHEPLAAVVMAHVLPDLAPRLPKVPASVAALAGTAVLGLALGIVADRAQGGARAWTLEREMFPTDAVAFLEANPELPRELFNPYEWGGYLEWRLYPHFRTFIDGRANTVFTPERYARALWVQYGEPWRERLRQAGMGPVLGEGEWDTVLEEAGIRMVLCSHVLGVGDLCDRLARSGRWIRVHDDRVASVFLRDDPASRELATRLRHPETAWSLLGQALTSLSRGDEEGARALLLRSVALDPVMAEPRVYLGVLLLRAGRDLEGLEQLETALALDPSVREAHFNLGLRAWKRGDRAEATDHFEAELETNPEHSGAADLLRQARGGGGGG